MTAVVSPCGQYRYTLHRRLADAGLLYAFIGINPSTADADLDDATVRRWTGFVSRWGGMGYWVGNAFAWRATDVRQLACADDPVGRDNDAYLDLVIDTCDVLVPCWGNRAKLPAALRPRLDQVTARLRSSGKPVQAFGLTAGGDPLHPLMLPYSARLRFFQ